MSYILLNSKLIRPDFKLDYVRFSFYDDDENLKITGYNEHFINNR